MNRQTRLKRAGRVHFRVFRAFFALDPDERCAIGELPRPDRKVISAGCGRARQLHRKSATARELDLEMNTTSQQQ